MSNYRVLLELLEFYRNQYIKLFLVGGRVVEGKLFAPSRNDSTASIMTDDGYDRIIPFCHIISLNLDDQGKQYLDIIKDQSVSYYDISPHIIAIDTIANTTKQYGHSCEFFTTDGKVHVKSINRAIGGLIFTNDCIYNTSHITEFGSH